MATGEVAVNMSGTASNTVQPSSVETPSQQPEVVQGEIKEGDTPPPADKPKEEKPNPDQFDLSKKFAVLARREKQNLLKEKELKEKWGELEKFQKLKSSPKDNIPSILQELGITYSEITDAILNDGKPTVEMKLRALEQRIEQEKIQREKDEADKKQREQDEYHQRVIDGHKRQIKEFVDSKAEDFELIKANDAAEEVFNWIQENWSKTGKIIPIDKACADVEEVLLDQFKKFSGLKKVKSFFEPKVEEKPKDVAQPMPRVVPRMVENSPRTLTNQMAAQAIPSKQSTYLSDDDSKKAAAEFIKKMLSK